MLSPRAHANSSRLGRRDGALRSGRGSKALLEIFELVSLMICGLVVVRWILNFYGAGSNPTVAFNFFPFYFTSPRHVSVVVDGPLRVEHVAQHDSAAGNDDQVADELFGMVFEPVLGLCLENNIFSINF